MHAIYENYQDAFDSVLHEAQHGSQKDFSYRLWVNFHGGVYVPVTKDTPPNPFLAHVPNRDIESLDGQQLTLIDPAYAMTQITEKYGDKFGIINRLTGKYVLNPKNKPDKWERNGLDMIEKTRKPYFEKTQYRDENYMRYLYPLIIQSKCLKCHAMEGYQIGDLRGAISIAIPTQPFYDRAFTQSARVGGYFFLIWGVGLFLLIWGYRRIYHYINTRLNDYEQHVYSLVDMIEKRDSYTAGHTERVAEYAELIGQEMGCNDEALDTLRRAAMLHDVGKVSTPDSILLKPSQLSDLEFDLIKEHVTTSYELLIKVDAFRNIAEIVKHHHERYDGKGYPQGLKNNEIPFLSHILSVADAFDAMTTNRIYKGRKTVEAAMSELNSLSGKQFHPEVVTAAQTALANVLIDTTYNQIPKTNIEQERFSYFFKDVITGVYSRDYLDFVLSRRIDQASMNTAETEENFFQYSCVHAIFLHDFTQFNKKYGWEEGNNLLKRFAELLQSIVQDGLVFRLYGDDFIIMNKDHFSLEEQVQKIEKILEEIEVVMTFQHIDLDKENIQSLSELEQRI